MVPDRPFNEGRVQIANVAVSASTVSSITKADLIMLRAKRPLYPTSDIGETPETGVSDQRGRRKTAESFTQAAPNELKLGEGG